MKYNLMNTYTPAQQPQTLQRIYTALNVEQRQEIKRLLQANRKIKTYAKRK